MSLQDAVEVGDYVEFVEPNFPRTGKRGHVEGKTPFTVFVCFDDGVTQTWPRHYFEKRGEPIRPPLTTPPPPAEEG